MTHEKEYIACYKQEDQWVLITKEISSESHCIKMSEEYKKSYPVKIIHLKELHETTGNRCKVCGCPTFGRYCAKHKP